MRGRISSILGTENLNESKDLAINRLKDSNNKETLFFELKKIFIKIFKLKSKSKDSN